MSLHATVTILPPAQNSQPVTLPAPWGMAQPRLAMGETAATMLLDRIEGAEGPGRVVTMRADFVERGSIAAPA